MLYYIHIYKTVARNCQDLPRNYDLKKYEIGFGFFCFFFHRNVEDKINMYN
jgi:hypothetical protein